MQPVAACLLCTGLVFQPSFVSGTLNAALSLCGQCKALEGRGEPTETENTVKDICYHVSLPIVWGDCSCYNNKQSSSNDLTKSHCLSSEQEMASTHFVVLFFCCFVLLWPRGQESGHQTPRLCLVSTYCRAELHCFSSPIVRIFCSCSESTINW